MKNAKRKMNPIRSNSGLSSNLSYNTVGAAISRPPNICIANIGISKGNHILLPCGNGILFTKCPGDQWSPLQCCMIDYSINPNLCGLWDGKNFIISVDDTKKVLDKVHLHVLKWVYATGNVLGHVHIIILEQVQVKG